MTVILDPDTSQVGLFRGALSSGAAAVDTSEALTAYLDKAPQEYAVILGPSVSQDLAVELAERYRVARPALGVILVRHRVDSSVLASAMRAGMREVIEARDLPGIEEAVTRARVLATAMAPATTHSHAEQGDSHGQVVTVFSTKGGVGKTTVATNLALALADQGKKVCLVDLDVHNGDVGLMLQIFPTRTLGDLRGFRGNIDLAGVGSLVTEHSPGLGVLAAPVGVDTGDGVSADDVTKALEVLTRQHDVVLVDTSGSFDDYALNAIDHSSLLLLVGTLDIPALKNLKLAASTLELLGSHKDRWRLVLNRADAKVGLSQQEFSDTLGLPVATAIPSSRDVLTAVNKGEPIVRSQPRHEVSRLVTGLAEQVLAAIFPDEARTETTGRGHRRGRKVPR